MKNDKIIEGLDQAAEWIMAVAGSEADQSHIKKMLKAIDKAMEVLNG